MFRSFIVMGLSAFLAFTVITVGVFGLWPTKKANAIFGVADVDFTTVTSDLPGLIGDILEQIVETAFAAAKKAALQWITKRITNAILGVNDTTPGFIQLWSTYLFDAADQILGESLNDLFGADLCKLPNHFDAKTLQANLKISLGIGGIGGTTPGLLESPHTTFSACKLSSILKNVDGLWNSALQASDKIYHDGWKNFSLMLQPTGNEFGVYLSAATEGFALQQEQTMQKAVKGMSYGGYEGKVDPKTGETLVPGSTGQFAVNEALMTPIRDIISADDIQKLAAAIFTASLVRLLNEGLAAADVGVRVKPSQVGL